MQVNEVQYDDIKKGDFIVRTARHNDEIFTQSGVASFEDALEMPYGIIRHYWYSEDRQTLAYVDRNEKGTMEDFPEGWNLIQRVTT